MTPSRTLILWNDRGGRPVTPPFEPFPEASATPDVAGAYVVVQRDTLRSICFKVYNDAGLWLRLAEVNRIDDPQAPLRPNTVLLTPSIEYLLDWTG